MSDNKIRVLITDDNRILTENIKRELELAGDFEVTGVAGSGTEAVEMLLADMPDILVLDLVMPRLDGFGVLKRLNAEMTAKKPLCVVLSAINNDRIVKKASLLGADCFICKPFSIRALAEAIRQLAGRSCTINPNGCENAGDITGLKYDINYNEKIFRNATLFMHKEGIPVHLKGYRYLREAIINAFLEPEMLGAVTKRLYPKVAGKFATTPSRVERAMRNAIELAWQKKWKADRTLVKPYNSEFIAAAADEMRLLGGVEDQGEI